MIASPLDVATSLSYRGRMWPLQEISEFQPHSRFQSLLVWKSKVASPSPNLSVRRPLYHEISEFRLRHGPTMSRECKALPPIDSLKLFEFHAVIDAYSGVNDVITNCLRVLAQILP